jgi:hypothetical protein
MAAVAMLAVPCLVSAQELTDACVLMGRNEFQVLTGKTEHGAPHLMPWGGGTACGFEHGQILLFIGPDSRGDYDRLMVSFGQQDLPRTPVDGVGEDAFAFFADAGNANRHARAVVVFGAGQRTVAVIVYAGDGAPPETALQPALAVAGALAGKLR